MNKQILGATCAVLAMGAASCGGKVNRAKLTDEQKSTLQQTITSVGRTQSAAMEAKNFASRPPDPLTPSSLSAMMPTPSVSPAVPAALRDAFTLLTQPSALLANADATVTGLTSAALDDRVQQMRQRLNRRLSDQSCAVSALNTDMSFDASGYSTRLTSQMPSANLAITGPDCPIAMKMDFAATMPDRRSANLDLNWRYSVQDEDFRKLNDVDRFGLAGAVKMQSTGDSRLSMDIGFEGDIHSQSRGAIGVKVSGHIEGNDKEGDGNLDLSFAYPDFTATLGVSFDDQRQHYFIGSDEVSAEQFRAFFSNGLPAGDSGRTR